MQALHLLALEPVAESTMEPNYYGFRPYRSAMDAIDQCYNCLAQKGASKWVLEGDIKSCFDNINHQWLLDNILTDKQILKKWLKCGVVDNRKFYSTNIGTPQGGIISPTLANLTLNGMESLLKKIPAKHKVHVITYADDFVITAKSKEVLQEVVKPKIEAFLNQRGLQLSQDKTSITHIDKGFDFLGYNLRKYKGKLLTKPSKDSVKNFLKDIRDTVKSHKTATSWGLIHLLNPKIRGWTNYYRHVVAKKTFQKIDHNIFWLLCRWVKRKHPNKNSTWMKTKYFRSNGSDNWIFHAKTKNQGKLKFFDLFKAGRTPIIRRVKIRGHANPYDPAYKEYFENRKIKKLYYRRKRK